MPKRLMLAHECASALLAAQSMSRLLSRRRIWVYVALSDELFRMLEAARSRTSLWIIGFSRWRALASLRERKVRHRLRSS